MTELNTTSTTKSGHTRQSLGGLGERMAARALEERGYRILARNFRCQYGEIDLVASDRSDLVFVEVKTRRGVAHGLPEEAVTAHKARRLQQVALCYLEVHNLGECAWRIDVVAVQFSPRGMFEEVRIYQNAIVET